MTTLNPTLKKASPSLPEFIALIALITSLVALSIDAMLPALPNIAQDLQVVDYRQTQWVITSLIFGMSFGQLVFGPMSDAYGRKFAILSGIALFSLGSVLSMTANSMTMLIAGRILQGIGVSGPRIASMALVRDKYVGDHMARVMSFVMMVFILVPMLAPIVGQWILQLWGWREIFALFIVLSVFAGVWLSLRQAETLAVEARRPFRAGSILKTSVQVLKHPRVLGFSITSGLIFGGLLSYVASAQAIFQGIYGLGENFPYYFAALAFGIGCASLVNSSLVVRFGAMTLSQLALLGLLILSTLLLVIAWLNGGNPSLSVFMGIGFAMFFFVGILFGNLNSLAMVPLGRMAGIGAAVVGSVSNVVAVLVSGLVGWFFEDTLVPILLGIVISALMSLVIVLAVRHADDSVLS
jgi:DHA1 family bicyclomycin/chloramphenicol resistance-like MFS transporter